MAAKKAAEMTAEELKVQRTKWAAAKKAQRKARAAKAAAPVLESMRAQMAERDPAAAQAGHDASVKAAGTALTAGMRKTTTAPRAEDDIPGLGQHLPAAPVAPPAPAPAPKPKTNGGKQAMADRARALILEGKTNAEVRAVLVTEFQLPAKHAYYPSWYRAQLVMKGTITKEWARAHSGCAKK